MPIKTKRLRIPYAFPNAKLMYSTDRTKREHHNEMQNIKLMESLRKKGVYISKEVW